MKTKIHANIGIVIEFHKLINPYFSNIHSFMTISGLFTSDLITLQLQMPFKAIGRGTMNKWFTRTKFLARSYLALMLLCYKRSKQEQSKY